LKEPGVAALLRATSTGRGRSCHWRGRKLICIVSCFQFIVVDPAPGPTTPTPSRPVGPEPEDSPGVAWTGRVLVVLNRGYVRLDERKSGLLRLTLTIFCP
jgi:hypothetical protein